MKVLHLLDSLNRGGAEMLALDVCRNAFEHDLDLTLAALGGGDLEADFAGDAPHFVCLQRRLPIDPSVIWKLRGVIKKQKIEIIHAHQAVEGLHAYFAALGTGAKLVLSFHGYIADAKNRRALKFLLKRTAANIAVSREFLIWLGEREKLDISRNFHVIYNGVDAKRLAPSGADLRAKLGLPPDAMVVGMVGNFYVDPRKDQMTLCRALPALFAKIPNSYCLIVGAIEDGAETKFAESVRFCKDNGILDRVKFLGKRADVPDILHALDIFVLSSLHESFGIAAVEAMLAGVPCVLANIAPFLEISQNGELAEIFETQNAEMLTEKLLHLAAGKTARQDLAVRAKQFAVANFSIEAHLQKLKTLYERLVLR